MESIRSSPDCFCGENGDAPWCSVCVVATAAQLRRLHPDSLSVSLLKRRIPGITGREASYLVEMSKRLLTESLPLEDRRNGQKV